VLEKGETQRTHAQRDQLPTGGKNKCHGHAILDTFLDFLVENIFRTELINFYK